MIYVVVKTKKPRANWFLWAAPSQLKQSIRILSPDALKLGVPSDCTGLAVTSLSDLLIVDSLSNTQDLLWETGSSYTHSSLIGCFQPIVLKDNRTINLLYTHSMVAMNAPSSGHIRVMYNRLMKKFLPDHKSFFITQPKLDYKYLDSDTSYLEEVRKHGDPIFLACDLETLQNVNYKDKKGNINQIYAVIDIASWSAVYLKDKKYVIKTWVVPMRKPYHHSRFAELMLSPWMKSWHNGNYDRAYLLRWRMPVYNSIWDTMYYPQSVSSDMKGFYALNSTHTLSCRYSKYWKGLANWKIDRTSNNTPYFSSFCKYSALDTHNAAEITITQMLMFNKQNFINYCMRTQFSPVTTLASMEHMFFDPDEKFKLAAKVAGDRDKALKTVEKVFGMKTSNKEFTPLLKALAKTAKILGVPEVPTVNKSDKKVIEMLRGANSFYDYALGAVAESRLKSNWMSTYISMPTVKFKGREIFMSDLSSYLTQSLRFNAKASSFWFGTNSQNVPKKLRSMFKPPEGYVFVASDAPQSESYTTGYESNCKEMLEILEDPDIDWHKNTASVCFGVPYDKITKALRTLAKPVGHGFNYNMGAYALLMNMGLENARRVRRDLGLPEHTPLVSVMVSLIKSLSDKFYVVRNVWYQVVAGQVVSTGRLTCKTGFAPLILQDIQYDTKVLNSIVSLGPQHLSVYLNTRGALSSVIEQISTAKRDETLIRYMAQIHDENVFLVPENLSIATVDAYILKHFTNYTSYPDSPKGYLSIPVGVPVVGNTWGDLSQDEIPREGLDLSLPIKTLSPSYKRDPHEELTEI